MDDPEVDLSEIRGDWHYHMRFLTNSMTQTLKRAVKLWDEVKSEVDDESIGRLVARQSGAWTELTDDRDAEDAVKTDSEGFQQFLDLCRSTKEPCDALELAKGLGGSSSIYDNTLEQFTEACRQARGLCDDLQMMREQRPRD